MSAGRKLASLMRAGPASQALVAEALGRLMLARLMLKVDRFERIRRRLGTMVAPDDARVAAASAWSSAKAARIAQKVRWALRATAPVTPFGTTCLSQAIAAHAMLRRRGVHAVMHFGMDHHDPLRKGHAWLEAAGVPVTGYPVDAGLTELSCIV